MKIPNLRIIGVEGKENPENIFNKIIEENFPNLKKECLSRYKKVMEHQVDWIRNYNSMPHNNLYSKHTEQRKTIKSRKGRKTSNI